MGRAGGGGGGHSSSSGGHSSSRSSGGHSSSSSRAGSSSSHRSSSSSSYRSSSSSYSSGRHYRHDHGHYDRGYSSYNRPVVNNYYGGTRHSSGGSYVTKIIVTCFLVYLAIFIYFRVAAGAGILDGSTKSTHAREKLNTGVMYTADCIVDEIDWFDNTRETGKRLRAFYDKTGVQPFIVLKAYDPSLVTNEDKIKYAEQWYEDNIDNEGTFLYMYFAEYDQDGDVGFMSYVNGHAIEAMMDGEAVEIFWDNIDSYWYTDLSTDDVFVKAFTKTGDRITEKSKTFADILWPFVIGFVVVIVGVVIIRVMTKKRQIEKERAEETERILSTPIATGTTSKAEQDLLDKYK